MDYQSFDLKTADGQMVALSEMFEKRGFHWRGEDISLNFVMIQMETMIYSKRMELITRLNFQKGAQDPVTWVCNYRIFNGRCCNRCKCLGMAIVKLFINNVEKQLI